MTATVRRLALPIALLAGTLLSACGSPESRAGDLRASVRGSNVLLIVVDSLCPSHTSLERYERDTTPQLARLAADSVRFADVTASSPSGFASAASLLCGEAVDVLGVLRPGDVGPKSPASPGATFKANGYDVRGISTHPAAGAGLAASLGSDVTSVPRSPGSGVPDALHAFVEELLTNAHEQPFFAYVHLGELAPSRAPRAESAGRLLGYVPERDAGDADFLRSLEGRNAVDRDTLMGVIDAYDATLLDIDEAIGRWAELVRRTARSDDTILVVASTRGQAFGQRKRFGAGGDLHQEQIAVPLLVRLPGGALGGSIIRTPVALYDLLPTLADLAGVASGGSVTGESLLPLLTDDWLERRHPIVSRTAGASPQYALRQGHFKLIARPGTGTSTLHHLERDPLETTNHGVPRPETLLDLQRALEDFRRAVGSTPTPARAPLSAAASRELTALGYDVGEPGDG